MSQSALPPFDGEISSSSSASPCMNVIYILQIYSHVSLLFFHSDSLSHELKEEPIDFPIA